MQPILPDSVSCPFRIPRILGIATRKAREIVAFFPEIIRESQMAKTPNLLQTEEVTLSLNSQTIWYLERLVERGLYGNSRAEAAKVVLYDHCKLLIGRGDLEQAPAIPPKRGDVVTV